MPDIGPQAASPLEQVLGYLNFSTGAADPSVFLQLNQLYEQLPAESQAPRWRAVCDHLASELTRLGQSNAAFRDSQQARRVLDLLSNHVLPAYREFHRDLLFHQSDDFLFGPFFVGRAMEAIVQHAPPDEEPEQTVQRSLTTLNDYIGHRPVAALESRKLEPYPKEWVRPVPIYIRGAGVATGPFQEVVKQALELLRDTDEDILEAAYFDPELLDELAVDPRAFDFDHPVNKRPNYHFGQWDPHHIDNQGRYRRFVVQQVTLDALMSRVVKARSLRLSLDEAISEAAAVLAGTVLMATGVSGRGPETHDSNVTLANMLPRIANFRDQFYLRLFARMQGKHRDRLEREAKRLQQPFGGARQHLNAALAKRRATQLERVHLAKIFAAMGYTEAARRQVEQVDAASARMLCQVDCLLCHGHRAVDEGRLEDGADYLPQIRDVVQRAIECGAVIDPWNILGFDAHFSLFPALENSVHDHRADELIAIMDQLFGLYSRLWSEAAAVDNKPLCERLDHAFRDVTNWWRQFATHEVSSVEATDAEEAYQAARHVATALNLWHKGGAAAGDVRFWAPHAEMFDSPKAYALVIDALLALGDLVASMALLMHWLEHAPDVALDEGSSSFYRLAEAWLGLLRGHSADDAHPLSSSPDSSSPDSSSPDSSSPDAAAPDAAAAAPSDASPGPARGQEMSPDERWKLLQRFFDFLEANADEYWEVPQFDLSSGRTQVDPFETSMPQPSEDDEIFEAAYEDMVFRDSTDDGFEGEIFDEGSDSSDDELTRESRRIGERLAFLGCVARLWKLVSICPELGDAAEQDCGGLSAASLQARRSALARWSRQACRNRHNLLELLDVVHAHQIPVPCGDHDSMIEYDRRRLLKETLLENIIHTTVDTADAVRFLLAAVAAGPASPEALELPEVENDEQQCIDIFGDLMMGQPESVRRSWPNLLETLRHLPLLYVPLAKGGHPRQIVEVRMRQHRIQDLLAWLPRAGMLLETCHLIEIARTMERNQAVGPGAVTEFDELFTIGYRSLVEALVHSAGTWKIEHRDEKPADGESPQAESGSPQADSESPRAGGESPQAGLVAALEQLTETLLISWLSHSRTLRLSVLERVQDEKEWKELVEFIKTYGEDLFTQRFLNLGNVRAILHQGAGSWFQQLVDDRPFEVNFRLLDDLGSGISTEDAADLLSLVLEAIIENYGEYRDYNSTTTHSDHGDHLYMLLDFLRLRCRYDRICWNLRPVMLAHDILLRHKREDAAEMWRSALTAKINPEADSFLADLKRLQKKYAMRMPTVADRLNERFIRPMTIDRICALVEPAMKQVKQGNVANSTFEELEHEIETLAREPSGVGLDIPMWLLALQEEVEQAALPKHERDLSSLDAIIKPRALRYEDTQSQLDRWEAEVSGRRRKQNPKKDRKAEE